MAKRQVGRRLVLRAGVPSRANRIAAKRILQEIPAHTSFAGVDEAGRGCLAGPVVAAAVMLPASAALAGLTDSKLLTPEAREALAPAIRAVAVAWAVAAVEAATIDATDIVRATFEAMRLAICQLVPPPELILVDGNVTPTLPLPVRAVVKGDRLVPAISAASILAKVTRDHMMEAWGLEYPAYGFAQHKGYGTADHLAAIAREGPSPIHRRTFTGVREYVPGVARQGVLW